MISRAGLAETELVIDPAKDAPLKSRGIFISNRSRGWDLKQGAHHAALQTGKCPRRDPKLAQIIPNSKVTRF